MEAIPTEILRIVQQFLNKRDYRNLLNSSHSIFQSAKLETVYYDILANWHKRFKRFEHYLPGLYDSVKDKGRQFHSFLAIQLKRILNNAVAS